MATQFTWSISQLERETSDGYVYSIHYVIDASDEAYSSGAYGSIGLERPENDMIPYDSLTPDICVEWVKESLGTEKVAEIEAALQAQLDEKHTPSKATGLPWS